MPDTIVIEESKATSGIVKKCPGYFVKATCAEGHSFVKTIHCGREWCPICGQKDSIIHLRRVARWLPKAFQIKSMGYFVFTIPEEARPRFRNKKVLSDLMKRATVGDSASRGKAGILKSFGFERGLSRWHWFGDKSTRYNPHLNVIVNGARINHSTLRKIKRAWAELLGVPLAVVNYEYRVSPGQKYHLVNYITRPTFTDISWDNKLAVELFNFRNTRTWGIWDSEPVWKLDDGTIDFDTMIKFERGVCPFCGKPIQWSKIIPIEFIADNLLHICPGYYLIM